MNNNGVIFWVPGKLRGKGRPRAQRRGRHIHIHPTDKDISYENWVKACYLEDHPKVKFKGAVKMRLTVFYPVPKSYSKKKTERCLSGEVLPTKKPDCDNIEKIISDALNGIAYLDDKQIVESEIRKKWSKSGEEGVSVTLEEIGEAI